VADLRRILARQIREAMERLTALAPLVPAPPSGRAETVPLLSSHDGE
jgi:hypothetical protein